MAAITGKRVGLGSVRWRLARASRRPWRWLGPGPQYHPGHRIDHFPDRYWKVPHQGQDYYYSSGYWYRPQGGAYVLVRPPYGVRVGYLPVYAQEVWFDGTLFFRVSNTYYQYLSDSQEYVVVNPPTSCPRRGRS